MEVAFFGGEPDDEEDDDDDDDDDEDDAASSPSSGLFCWYRCVAQLSRLTSIKVTSLSS